MLKRQINLITLFWSGLQPTVLVALALWLGFGSRQAALAQAPYEDTTTSESWAWSKIGKGEWADFNQRCDTAAHPFDPKVDNSDSQDDCRKLTASFLEDLLTKPPWREATPFAGVRIRGARIVKNLGDTKDLDLEGAKLIRPLEIIGSRIEAAINLVNAQTDSLISFNSSVIDSEFHAEGLRSSSDLDMRGVSLDGGPDATGLRVDGSLDMSSVGKDRSAFKKVVKLNSAKTGQNIQMFGAIFEGELEASYLQVGGYLSMGQYSCFNEQVSLNGARISGLVDIGDATFGNKLNADYLQVGSYLSMRKAHFADEVSMAFVKISGPMDFSEAVFDSKLDAYGPQVGGYLSMQNTRFAG